MRTQVVNAGDPIHIAQDFSLIGAGIASLTVSVIVKRISDGKYWSGAAWQVGTATVSMSAVTGITGLYEYSIAATAVDGADYALAFPGYYVLITEPTTAFFDVVHVCPMVDLNQATLANTLTVYDALRRMVAIRQDNMNVLYDAWTADGKPTHGTVWIYNSKTAADADTVPDGTGSSGEYEWTATYDGSLRIEGYKSTREA